MPSAQTSRPKGPRPKHVPQRTCVVCRSERGKRELVRIVRAAAGGVQVDPTGKVAGRGAYLCKSKPCWNVPGFTQRLNAALKTALTPEDTVALKAYVETLPEE